MHLLGCTRMRLLGEILDDFNGVSTASTEGSAGYIRFIPERLQNYLSLPHGPVKNFRERFRATQPDSSFVIGEEDDRCIRRILIAGDPAIFQVVDNPTSKFYEARYGHIRRSLSRIFLGECWGSCEEETSGLTQDVIPARMLQRGLRSCNKILLPSTVFSELVSFSCYRARVSMYQAIKNEQ